MKSYFKFSLLLAVFFASTAFYAQGTLKGKVVDIDGNDGLPGASVMIQGTTNGVVTDMNGNFSLQAPASGVLVIKFVGYNTINRAFSVASGETNDIGKIGMASNSTLLGDVVIVGVADVAKDRKTPVAVSTITAAEIQEKLGSQEFPEILNNTPSVYATKQGGGFGDARINIRGFAQENIAVMINGVPVNDMENGRVYWSNWAGLSDVTTAMQVQRGLGSSKLAISSVGGTINILTKTTDAKQGGRIGFSIGNDGYNKSLVSYSTGKLDNNLAVSALFSRTSGNGFVDGTNFEGYNFFLGIGYEPNKNHNLQFTITGAPQWHHQRNDAPTISAYTKYSDNEEPNIRYNSDWGILNGEEFSYRKNFYHKPVASVNWDWLISEKSKLSTVFYTSKGRGGGTGPIGRYSYDLYNSTDTINEDFYGMPDENGIINFDDIVASNSGGDPLELTETNDLGNDTTFYFGTTPNSDGEYINSRSGNGFTRRASINSHNWIGSIINLNNKLSDKLTLDLGLDLRKYTGIHYRRLDNLLGADGYYDNRDQNNPDHTFSDTYASTIGSLWNVFRDTDDEKKIEYHNDGLVNWMGAFTQLEYSAGNITAFVQGAVSNQSFKRIDYFNFLNSDPKRETDWQTFSGGNIKGGLNFNINENHNVYFNTGYYSKQPLFNAVFIDFKNGINDNPVNEKIFGLELGYGIRTNDRKLVANINIYNTSWKDRFLSVRQRINGINVSANIQGIEEIHRGIEIDGVYRVIDNLKLSAMLSVGDWFYNNDVSGTLFDEDQNDLGIATLYLKDVKVGDAAQTTARFGVIYEPIERLYLDFNWRLADQLYADIDVRSFDQVDHLGSLKLPSYNLLDAGVSYKLLTNKEKDQSLLFRLNVNNLTDLIYISESRTNIHVTDDSNNWNGINDENEVFFGFGRTWNFGINYRF